MDKQLTWEQWINWIADRNGYDIKLADNIELIEEIGYWKKDKFVLRKEIRN